MARKPLIAGNWKMNLNHLEAIALVQKIAFSLPEKYYAKVDVTVLPPFTDIRSVQTLVDGDKLLLTYGAQDVSPHDSGAYTGEVSAPMLAKLGCTYVVVGHSERRQYHGETSELVARKFLACKAAGLTPILCVGESLSEREDGQTQWRIQEQLEPLFELGGEPGTRQNIVVVKHGGHKFGLVVDLLLGEVQTVIKPLSKMFAHVKGISGSSILGSGEVALILDVPALLEQTHAGRAPELQASR